MERAHLPPGEGILFAAERLAQKVRNEEVGRGEGLLRRRLFMKQSLTPKACRPKIKGEDYLDCVARSQLDVMEAPD